jgi:hypothetical protein
VVRIIVLMVVGSIFAVTGGLTGAIGKNPRSGVRNRRQPRRRHFDWRPGTNTGGLPQKCRFNSYHDDEGYFEDYYEDYHED